MDYSDRDLSNTLFKGKDLSGANFNNSVLTNANFEASSLQEASFINAHLVGANFGNANLEGSNFTEANLTNADLSKTNIRGCNFTDSNSIDTSFEYAETGISWIVIFNIFYAAFGGAALNTVAVTSGHSSVNSTDCEIPNQSIGNLLVLIALGIILTCIFSQFVVSAYQKHNLSSLVTTVVITLFCFTYSIYSSLRVIKKLKKYSGSSFNSANLSGAKFNYALIADTDFANAITIDVDWQNSKSKWELDEIV